MNKPGVQQNPRPQSETQTGEAKRLAAIPTGSLRLDIALKVGGVLCGAITGISGPDSSGKTTLCQHIIAEAQKLGGLCAIIDAEHALTPLYAARCGVDLDQVYISEPENAEQALEITARLVHSGAFAVVALDSVTALVPQSEIEARLGNAPLGRQDKLVSQVLSRLSGSSRQTNTALILTSQSGQETYPIYHKLRENPSRIALQLHAATRLELQPVQNIRKNGEICGNRVQVRVVKHKFGSSIRPFVLDIMYNHGVLKTGDILDFAIESNLLKTQAGIFYYKDLSLGAGRDEAIRFLRQNSGVAQEIEQAVRQRYFPPAETQVDP